MRTGANALAAPRRALRTRDVLGVGRADVRSRRGGRPQLLRADSRRPLRRQGEDGQQRTRRRRRRVRGAVEVEGSTCASTTRTSPTRTRPHQLPLPSTVSAAASRSRCSRAETRRRTRAISARSRSWRGPVRCSTLSPSPCFLYGWPAMQSIEVIYQAVSKAMPEAVPACSGGRPLRARLVGRPRGDAASRGRTVRRIRSARAPTSTATAHQPSPRRRVGDALLAYRGLGVTEPVAPGARRTPRRLLRAGEAPRRPRARDVLPHARGLVRDFRDRADEDATVGARGRDGGAGRMPTRCGLPTARGGSSGRPPACTSRKARLWS